MIGKFSISFLIMITLSVIADPIHKPIPIEIQNGILKYEGSIYTNDPRDPGGSTRYGWTLKTYKMIHPGASVDDIKNLTWPEALLLYEKHFWWVHGTEWLEPTSLAGTVLLAQINLGANRPDRLLQEATNELCDSHLKVDGMLGKSTVHAVNHCKGMTDYYSVALFRQYYIPLSNKMPYYKKGWRLRSLSYAKLD